MNLRLSKFWMFVLWFSIFSVLGALLSWVSGMPLWGAWLIVGAAMFVNGLIAEWEDHQADGFLDSEDE